MSDLAFALDEDVPHRLASLLRSFGWNADSAKELARLGLSDVQVLLRAADDGRVVITYNNRDFRALHEAWLTLRQRWTNEVERRIGIPVELSPHAGILIVPPLPVHQTAGIIQDLAETAAPLTDRLFAWSAARHWREPLVPRFDRR